MPRRIRTARRTDEQIQADIAAGVLAEALGKAPREARATAGLTQAEVGRRSGLAQTSISFMERGMAVGVSLRTWVRAASVVGVTLKAYLSQVSTAGRPTDGRGTPSDPGADRTHRTPGRLVEHAGVGHR